MKWFSKAIKTSLDLLLYLIKFKAEWIIVFIVSLGVYYYGTTKFNFIKSDGEGYYAYLPALFIYHDLDYDFIEYYQAKYFLGEQGVDFRREVQGEIANMNFVGLAVLWLPFFFMAHFASMVLGYETDGYSTIYQFSIGLAALFYLLLGLYYMRKLLKLYGARSWVISLVQVLLVFATPLYYFSVDDACFTHLYSFTMIVLFLYFAKQYFSAHRKLYLYLGFVMLGMIIIIRPTNMMIFAAVPFIAGSWKNLVETTRCTLKNYGSLFLAIALLFLVLCFQFAIWYAQTGHFIAYTYTDEGLYFNFLDPNISNVLFSYRKGLFIYTPITFFSLLGFAYLFKKSVYEAIALLIFLFINTYILASWSHWWYGMSYGNRAYVDFLAIFGLLLGFTFQINKRFITIAMVVIGILSVILNQIQIYQYRNYIFYWNMDKESYWRVFLRTDESAKGMLWRDKLGPKDPVPVHYFTNKFEGPYSTLILLDFEDAEKYTRGDRDYILEDRVYNGTSSYRMTKRNNFSPGLKMPYKDITQADTLQFTAMVNVFTGIDPRMNPFTFVVSVENNYKVYIYEVITVDETDLKAGQWTELVISTTFRNIRSSEDLVKAYVWYRGDDEIYIDDLEVRIYNPSPE